MKRTRLGILGVIVAAAFLASAMPAAGLTLTSSNRTAIVSFAKAQNGRPYSQSNAINPKTNHRVRAGYDKYDCSGLVWRAYKDKTGTNLAAPKPVPYKFVAVASMEYTATTRKFTAVSGVLPADLVFVVSSGNVVHVGICDGKGGVTHASSAFGKVVTEPLATFMSRYKNQGKTVKFGGWYNTAR